MLLLGLFLGLWLVMPEFWGLVSQWLIATAASFLCFQMLLSACPYRKLAGYAVYVLWPSQSWSTRLALQSNFVLWTVTVSVLEA